MPSRKKLILLVALVFLGRLFFGLAQAKWRELDELQTYLIGLKCYTTGTWPAFGPDVNGAESSFQSQIPGALEGLLIGLPFYVLPIPEAPFLLLNLLSTAGCALLAWYVTRRIAGVSFAWLLLWISIAPWSLHEATHTINPSYTFLPAILFFIGFMESSGFFKQRLLSLPLANALMGLSIGWIMQFHFSYVYLLPLAGLSLGVQLVRARDPRGLLYFILGGLPMAALVAPTYLTYGLSRGNVASGFATLLNMGNVREFTTILARFFSLVCFEMPRFIGVSTKTRMAFLEGHPWLYLPGAFLWFAGILQPFILLFSLLKKEGPEGKRDSLLSKTFRKSHPLLSVLVRPLDLFGVWTLQGNPRPGWRKMKWLLVALFAMVYASFWFTIKMPLSHIYFVLFPFLMLYSCYCWVVFKDHPQLRALGKTFLILGLLFQLGYAVAILPVDSFYAKNENGPGIKRDIIVKALQEKNYRILGERRAGSLY